MLTRVLFSCRIGFCSCLQDVDGKKLAIGADVGGQDRNVAVELCV